MSWRQKTFKLNKQNWVLENGVWQPTIREEHVLREIVERLWLIAKIKVWRIRERIPGMGAPSTPGIPDLIGWVPAPSFGFDQQGNAYRSHPAPLFIECKRPGGVRRIAQIRFIDEAKAGGCIAGFCECWNDVVTLLRDHGIELPEG